jgi:hypothetical protein
MEQSVSVNDVIDCLLGNRTNNLTDMLLTIYWATEPIDTLGGKKRNTKGSVL